MNGMIMAACGNDFAACPRYCKTPFGKPEAARRHTAELWFRVGYRDRVVSNEEIACEGCREDTACRYRVVGCVKAKQIDDCGQCAEFPCQTIQECFAVTESFRPACQRECTAEEFSIMQKAFFEKRQNLERRKRQESEETEIEGARKN